MLNKREIDDAIAELENAKATQSKIGLLATLYTVRDHAFPEEQGYSFAAEPLSLAGDSDFLQAVIGKDQNSAWAVMDELMDTLMISYPRAYESIMRKIRNLGSG